MKNQVYSEVRKDELRKIAKERGGFIYACSLCGRLSILYPEKAPPDRLTITCQGCKEPKLHLKETER